MASLPNSREIKESTQCNAQHHNVSKHLENNKIWIMIKWKPYKKGGIYKALATKLLIKWQAYQKSQAMQKWTQYTFAILIWTMYQNIYKALKTKILIK